MREILPGIHHWTAMRETIGARVSCYYVEPAAILIDPLVPEEGMEALLGLPGRPRQVVLTNRHHNRDSSRIAAELDCPIRVPQPGMHEYAGEPRASAYAFGEEVAPGVRAHEVGVLAPDEAALHVAAGPGALAFGDTLTRRGGDLAFVPDELMGDDPPAIRAGLRAAFRRLLELDFDALLLAHGEPVASGGKAALEAFAAA